MLNTCVYILARYSQGKAEIVLSLILTTGFLLFGVFVLVEFFQEQINQSFLARSALSPYWFRALVFFMYCFPFFVNLSKFKEVK